VGIAEIVGSLQSFAGTRPSLPGSLTRDSPTRPTTGENTITEVIATGNLAALR
jgi:hypothetical protein